MYPAFAALWWDTGRSKSCSDSLRWFPARISSIRISCFMPLIRKKNMYKKIALRLTNHNVQLWQPWCHQFLLLPALRQHDIVSRNDLSLLGFGETFLGRNVRWWKCLWVTSAVQTTNPQPNTRQMGIPKHIKTLLTINKFIGGLVCWPSIRVSSLHGQNSTAFILYELNGMESFSGILWSLLHPFVWTSGQWCKIVKPIHAESIAWTWRAPKEANSSYGNTVAQRSLFGAGQTFELSSNSTMNSILKALKLGWELWKFLEEIVVFADSKAKSDLPKSNGKKNQTTTEHNSPRSSELSSNLTIQLTSDTTKPLGSTQALPSWWWSGDDTWRTWKPWISISVKPMTKETMGWVASSHLSRLISSIYCFKSIFSWCSTGNLNYSEVLPTTWFSSWRKCQYRITNTHGTKQLRHTVSLW